jgi:hypothetical protein
VPPWHCESPVCASSWSSWLLVLGRQSGSAVASRAAGLPVRARKQWGLPVVVPVGRSLDPSLPHVRLASDRVGRLEVGAQSRRMGVELISGQLAGLDDDVNTPRFIAPSYSRSQQPPDPPPQLRIALTSSLSLPSSASAARASSFPSRRTVAPNLPERLRPPRCAPGTAPPVQCELPPLAGDERGGCRGDLPRLGRQAVSGVRDGSSVRAASRSRAGPSRGSTSRMRSWRRATGGRGS